MKIITTPSVLGFVAGFIAFPLIVWAGAYAYFKLAYDDFDAGSGGGLRPPELPSAEQVSLDWTLRNLDGNEVSLRELAGGKVVFLNFWATWCGPCVAELPSIERLYGQFGNEVTFVCVSNEQAATLKQFLEARKYSLPFFISAAQPPPELNEAAIPATFIISPEGKILFKHVGGADWAHESVVAFLSQALGQD